MDLDTRLLKKRGFRFFFAAEIILFVVFYLFGSYGIQHLMILQQQQNELDKQLVDVKQEIANLHKQIEQWNSSSFFKEKIAREQLQMARDGDEVYYLG